MKISASQRKALEAAGYTVSKSGSTVQSKNGGTVGGYNENGKVFSGNQVVRDILKGTAETPKATSKATPKATSKVAPKAAKTQEKPVAKDAMVGYRKGDVTTTSLDKPKGGRGSGAAEVKRRKTDSFVNTMKTAVDRSTTKPKNTRPQTAAEKAYEKATERSNEAARKVAELEKQLEKNSAALAAASLGSGMLTRGSGKARGRPYNPTFGSQKLSPEGPQGRMNTTIGRPVKAGGAKGISGTNPAKTAKRIGSGGRRNTLQDPKDFNNFLN